MKAEKLVITDPRTSLTYARMALELAVNWMFQNDTELELPYDNTLNSLMKSYEFRNQFPHKLYGEIDLIRKVGNLAIHNKPVTSTDADHAIVNLFYFAKWFAKSYSTKELGDLGLFDSNIIPKEGEAALNKKQLETIQNQFDKELNKFQDELKLSLERNQLLEEKNELYKKQVATLQAQIEANKVVATHEDEKHHPRNESETRKILIDVLLREAGWDLKGANDKEYKVVFMPSSTNKSETGYIDYVLWDDDGKPLALVEAKKTMESVSKGENQAQLYADSLEKMFGRRPVMFYTNGFEINLWDDQFYKKSRPVHGFYSKQELHTLMFRRTNRKDIRTHEIDPEIAGRAYQMRSIKSIAEHFAGTDKRTGQLLGTNRGALLVLATGTGKTRVAISLSKLMLEANWVKRVLFLTDRISLVTQAKRNFMKFLPEHSSVNLLEDKENSETRFVFSTYQTMMGLIDDIRNGDERFYGIGHFDLVIIDEAHRSIYRKYQAIFEYFDALLLGLTATPKNSIDKNTYHIFGLADKSPTDAYPFEEAVANRHLVPYRTVEVPTKFQTKGIKYSELSPEEQAEFEEEILDGEKATGNEWVNKEALNAWLFNKDTAVKTLNYILKNCIKKRCGDEPGKTIIFARNQKHAHFLKDIFLELDKELYGNEYVKVITHSEPKAEEFIRRFCDDEVERLPQIAISVDMMDTGIDAPSVVNLVFYKPVKSYSKFWQMIGRGSRLRPDLFGPGMRKNKFLIFDLCGNFEFFEENPNGIETTIQKGLTELVFNLKLQLSHYLKDGKFKDDEQFQRFRQQLLDELHHEIANLDRSRFDVKMKLELVLEYGSENRELWNHMDAKDLRKIQDNLSNLVSPRKGDSDLARFYDKLLYTLMIKRIESPDPEGFMSRYSVSITKVAILSKKLLKKTTIPEVKQNEGLIKLPLEEAFWKTDGIAHLDQIRSGVRELIKYIDPVDQKYVTTDFEDELDETKVKTKDYASEPDTAFVSPFASNVHRLEEIVRENRNHITINRIRNGEPITRVELASLEVILLNGKLKKEELEKELDKKLDLVSFIITLIGLSEERVEASFARFINDYQLNSVQIQFLATIKLFFTQNGKIDPVKLYDSPFKNYHNLGIEGVFDEKQADQIFEIVTGLNQLHQVSG
jgi:type I restriction enzyme R subunit